MIEHLFDFRGTIFFQQGVNAFPRNVHRAERLDRAGHTLQRSKAETEQLDRQVDLFERLLALASVPDTAASDAGGLPLHATMVTVLRDAPQHMLRAGDLAAEVNRRHLYRMRDGRPVEAQQIHARVGHDGHRFVREGTFIKLVDQP